MRSLVRGRAMWAAEGIGLGIPCFHPEVKNLQSTWHMVVKRTKRTKWLEDIAMARADFSKNCNIIKAHHRIITQEWCLPLLLGPEGTALNNQIMSTKRYCQVLTRTKKS